MNLHKKDWTVGLLLKKYEDEKKSTELMLEKMARLSKTYHERIREDEGKTLEEVEVSNTGKEDPKKHLENDVHELMANVIIQCLGTMIDTVAF